MDTIEVTPDLWIPRDELVWKMSTSSGPGGQNVNRVRTRVVLSFNVLTSKSLTDEQRSRIVGRLSARIDRNGNLRVRAQKHRTQSRNRAEAIARLVSVLRDALREQPARKPTSLPRAADERRLGEKHRRSELKERRGKPDDWS